VHFNGWSDAVLDDLLAKDEVEAFVLISTPGASLTNSLSRLSAPEDDVLPKTPLSTDAPGVLGVFAEDPKDANAPEPNPNAEDAPFGVGEEILVVLSGDIPLNGFDLPPLALSPPNRFPDGNARGNSILLRSLLLLIELEVDRESLLELLDSLSMGIRKDGLPPTATDVARGYCCP
jgi:hypothetical protein